LHEGTATRPKAVAAYVEKTGKALDTGDNEASVASSVEQVQADRTFFVQSIVCAYGVR
jgi:hypothetical protein